MKRALLIITILTHYSVQAQWNEQTGKITTSDKIGIGVTSPTAKFEIETSKSDVMTLKSSNPGSASLLLYNLAGRGFQLNSTGPNSSIGGDKFSIFTNGEHRFVMDLNGKVGIGTTAPAAKFEIETSKSDVMTLTSSNSGSASLLLHNLTGRGFQLNSTGSGSSIGGDKFSIFTNGEHRFVMDINGKVGIGTTSPDSKLTVNGDIHAKECKIDINIPAPDYVFEADYDLRTLEETKSYIDENKHLPEIPSAKEMESNGVELGEMNMMLLKKIEELTLHQIELLEKLESQQSRIEKLEKRKK